MKSTLEKRRDYSRAYNKKRRKLVRSAAANKDHTTLAINLVERSWTLSIVRALTCGPMRRSDLQIAIGAPTESLNGALQAMEKDGLIFRTRYNEVPPRVDIELTQQGYHLVPIVELLQQWAEDWDYSKPPAKSDKRYVPKKLRKT